MCKAASTEEQDPSGVAGPVNAPMVSRILLASYVLPTSCARRPRGIPAYGGLALASKTTIQSQQVLETRGV